MTTGFTFAEHERLCDCLSLLLPHVRIDDIAVTGGVAMQIGLDGMGHPGLRAGIADLDLVAGTGSAVSATVTNHFLVSHYHVEQPGVPKYLLQLVDPGSRLRVDIFPDRAGAIGDAVTIGIGPHCMQVLPLFRILEHKLQTLNRASPAAPVDPKHLQDAQALAAVLGVPVPRVPPGALVPEVYGDAADFNCRRCKLSRDPAWPLAPMGRIYALLGWRPLTTTRAAEDAILEAGG